MPIGDVARCSVTDVRAAWPDDPTAVGTGLPLEGVRVLDLSKILAGPLCVLVAADLGADVIKVEAPRTGDGIRSFAPPSFGDDATYYLSVNRNRRSIAVDLATPEGHATVGDAREGGGRRRRELPAAPARRRSGSQTSARSSATWCGSRSAARRRPVPLADAPSFDLLAQARSGLMSVTGSPDGPPTKVGAPVADVVTGLYAAAALLAGLYARAARRRRAHRFEVPLLEATVTALVNQAQGYLVTREDPDRLGNDHPTIAPYGPVATRSRATSSSRPRRRRSSRPSARRSGDVALAEDPRFATNASRVEHRAALDEALRDGFAARTATEWAAALVDAGVPCGPVHTVASAIEDPQVRDGGLVTTARTAAGEFEMLRSPIRVDGEWLPVRRSPPALDQDGDDIRDALGASDVTTHRLARVHRRRRPGGRGLDADRRRPGLVQPHPGGRRGRRRGPHAERVLPAGEAAAHPSPRSSPRRPRKGERAARRPSASCTRAARLGKERIDTLLDGAAFVVRQDHNQRGLLWRSRRGRPRRRCST